VTGDPAERIAVTGKGKVPPPAFCRPGAFRCALPISHPDGAFRFRHRALFHRAVAV